jgi:dipeptidyl aminopeptidase/acylaminoacyl peptidase
VLGAPGGRHVRCQATCILTQCRKSRASSRIFFDARAHSGAVVRYWCRVLLRILLPPSYLHSALQADPEFAPPLLVKAHGGPTARRSTTFRLDVQFWTSRGLAVLDVDYGGSTGYNKAYRQSLLGKWGLLDVDDVKHAALYCVLQKKANANWICIDGRSAGGYTTLAAFTFTNTFRAGASLFGIGDLSLLADETHKFESRYLEGLIGPYPEGKEMFDTRCPILHLDQLTCPAILLQGDEDKVVPPSQAETMYAALRKKGLPSTLILYKGEQHGFRQSNHISHALLSEYSFFCQTFGFELQQEGDFKGIKIGERVEIE